MTVLSRPIGWVRGLVDVVFPRGAVVLSVLSLAYFGMGLIRNRVFANTYGAGAELDAYNAAFRIPEIALDVLVAAGLTAPFVPIFTSLRRTDEGAANTFGQTILTGAIVIMAVASTLLAIAAPWLADAFEGFDPATRALYIDLLRINCIAQVLFAASFALGEVLVANRRFAFYALAPVLYSTGIVLGTVLFAGRFGIYATAWGAVAGAVAHLGIRALGIRQTSFRIRAASAFRTSAFREFIRLMIPRMISHPIEPITVTYFTIMAASLGAGSVTALNFASDYQVLPVSLIGVAFSLAVFPTLSAAFAEGDVGTYRAVLGRNLLTIGVADHRLGDRPLPPVGDPGGRAARGREVRARRCRADGERRGRIRHLDPLRRPRLPALARALRHARHDPAGHLIVRRPGRRRRRLAGPGGPARDPRDPAELCGRHGVQGRAARDVPGRPRPADRDARGYGALTVGTTEM